jgi:hypothetical protein
MERIALWFETLANKLVGNLQLNPLYHTDTIAFYLLILVAVSGLYLVVFYKVGLGLVTLFLILAVALASVPYTP